MIIMFLYCFIFEETGSRTESDIIIHTRKSLPCLICNFDVMHPILVSIFFLCELDATVSDTKKSPEGAYWLFDCTDIWTKVFTTILYFYTSLYEFRHWWICNFYIRKIFIILHEDIIFRREVFDEIGLEHQCFHLSFTENCFYVSDFPDHLLFCESELSCAIKIGIHTAFKIFCFTDINDLPLFVFHLIDSWRFWEIF